MPIYGNVSDDLVCLPGLHHLVPVGPKRFTVDTKMPDSPVFKKVITKCGGKTFSTPATLFYLAPVLRDCISFCGDDTELLDLDPLFFTPLGVTNEEAAAVFQV